MIKINLTNCNQIKYSELLKRPYQDNSVAQSVANIIESIKKDPLNNLLDLIKKYDGLEINNLEELKASEDEINKSEALLSLKEKKSIDLAFNNIYSFHIKQLPENYKISKDDASYLAKKYLPIQNVGLYIPGGTAILPSTVLMLGIPAMIAGCPRIVLTTPVKGNSSISKYVLYAAKKCGIKEIYKIGGIQAIYLLAYGIGNIKKVDKIFGPGNRFVTAAKSYVANDYDANCAIDMPAGPSEVLVIADGKANPKFIAADLLSQAEHGIDSQVVLLTTSYDILDKVEKEIQIQTSTLERKEIIQQCLENSLLIKVETIQQAIDFSNDYAPEHLILHIQDFENYVDKIVNAGSVFLGEYSPESFGDYAAGTNHSLPTYGYARAYSGVGVDAFIKSITFQYHTYQEFQKLADTVETLAEIEGLDAHKNAVTIRKRG